MSPRAPQESVRDALIAEAARLLGEGGPDALSARKLAGLVGTSTTAVYTYFGSMEELKRAVRIEAFTRLAEAMEAVPETDNPVRDAAALGAAYLRNAMEYPELYRVMFLDDLFTDVEREVTAATLMRMARAVRRCVESGATSRTDHEAMAFEFCAATHGVASLVVSKMCTPDEAMARMATLAETMLRGLGVPADEVREAMAYAGQVVGPAARRPRRSRRQSRPPASDAT